VPSPFFFTVIDSTPLNHCLTISKATKQISLEI